MTATIAPATGRLGVLTVGLGAVATTLIAGVELVKRGQGLPIGSLTQMGTIRLGKRTEDRSPLVKDFVPLAALEDIVWGAWDVYPDDAYVAASRAGVLEAGKHIEAISDVLRDIRPMKAAFERKYARNLDGEHTMGDIGKRAMLDTIREDINRFRDEKQVDRVVMIWCASTEIFIEPGPAHRTSRASRRPSTPRTTRSHRRCCTPTPRSSRTCRSPTVHPTWPSTRRCCASWPPSATCRSAARTSRPARR